MFEDKKGDITYSDKDFNEIFVNFVGIETTCLKCYSSLLSKSKLHKYVRADCIKETLPPSSTKPSLSIPIMTSKTIHQSWASGLRFRGWAYATASITYMLKHLPPNSDLNSSACLDTGCSITLVNPDQFLKHLLYQNINNISILLKVKSIRTSMYKSVKVVALSLYFPGRNNVAQLVYTALSCEIYIVEGL